MREIVIDSDGELLISVNGVLDGPVELKKIAQRNSLLRRSVQFIAPHGEYFEANLDDGESFGETAALLSVRPGRSRILHAPPEIVEYLETSSGGCHAESLSAEFISEDESDES